MTLCVINVIYFKPRSTCDTYNYVRFTYASLNISLIRDIDMVQVCYGLCSVNDDQSTITLPYLFYIDVVLWILLFLV